MRNLLNSTLHKIILMNKKKTSQKLGRERLSLKL